MLEITIPDSEIFDAKNNRIIEIKGQTLKLEHSLVSLHKWESKWHKPFLSTTEKTYDEILDYIKLMTITQNVNPYVYYGITQENINDINSYIENPMTATTFAEEKSKGNREVITAEIIYYWMISLNIPFECQKWHLNKLFTLIKVCGIKNQPPKKMNKKDVMSRNAALNQARRKQLNSKG